MPLPPLEQPKQEQIKIKQEQEKPNPGTGTGSTTQQENPTKPSSPTTKPSTPTTKPTTPTVKPETKPEQNIENVPEVEEPEEEYIPAEESIVEEDDKYEEMQKRFDEELEKKFLKMDLIIHFYPLLLSIERDICKGRVDQKKYNQNESFMSYKKQGFDIEFKIGDRITEVVLRLNDGLGNVLLSYNKVF